MMPSYVYAFIINYIGIEINLYFWNLQFKILSRQERMSSQSKGIEPNVTRVLGRLALSLRKFYLFFLFVSDVGCVFLYFGFC
jgi:hypothetical protein